MYETKLDALVERYFNHIERRLTVLAGSVLIEQQGYNDRLYYVLSGELSGFYADEDRKPIQVFLPLKGHLLECTVFFQEHGLPHLR